MHLSADVDSRIWMPARHERRLPVHERVDVDFATVELTVAPAAFELEAFELRLKTQHLPVQSAARRSDSSMPSHLVVRLAR